MSVFRMRCGESTMGRDNVEIEWEPTEADRKRAMANHSQTLERLHERGGMSWCEMVAILADRAWRPMDQSDAKARVYLILQERKDGPKQALSPEDQR